MYGFLFAGESKTRLGRISGPRHVVNITTVFSGVDTKFFNVEATQDADVTVTIPHGLGATPAEISLLPASVNFYTKQWRATSADATNVTFTGTAAVGSGAVGNNMEVLIKRPHSIGR